MLTSKARNKVTKVTWSISRYQAWTYDLRNSSVLRLRLNDANDEDDAVCDGRLFHARAAATGNARMLSVFRWSEAQHDWPSMPTEGSVATQSPTHAWIRRRGSSAPVYGGICRPTPPACSGSDRDIEAMQITEERCHVLGSTGSVDQPRRRVEHEPQFVHQPIRDAGECGIAVVKARQNQWHDERHNHWARNWRTNAAESPQHRETAGHHLWDMSPHADVTVQIYSEVSDKIGRKNDVGADTQTGLWNLMLTSNGWTPEHFRLGCVELKTIRLHCIYNATSSTHPETAPSAARHLTGESSLRSACRQYTDEEFISAEIKIISTYLWPPKPRISKVPHAWVFVWTFRLRTLTLRWI